MPGLRDAAQKTKNYDTPLEPQTEADYQKTFPPSASADYDMRGWYNDNAVSMEKLQHHGHFTDEFKKPNHITFSTESKYSTPENTGGTWMGGDFAPSDKQVNTPAKVKKLKDYFHK
jgi:hypothetical protein